MFDTMVFQFTSTKYRSIVVVARLIFIFIPTILLANYSQAQPDSSIIKKQNTRSNYTNEFFVSAGYNYCRYDFFDLGFRYYHFKNDGQTAMAFAGTAMGCELRIDTPDQVYIPYLGWQGQIFMLGYGLRAEYAINKRYQSFGFSTELGISLFEMLRITGGYRFCFNKNETMRLNGFRFSVIAALPLSFLKTDTKKDL